jgi:hypothetical protein
MAPSSAISRRSKPAFATTWNGFSRYHFTIQPDIANNGSGCIATQSLFRKGWKNAGNTRVMLKWDDTEIYSVTYHDKRGAYRERRFQRHSEAADFRDSMFACGHTDVLIDERTTARDIKQIAVSPTADPTVDMIYALANDGTLWELRKDGESPWRHLPNLPTT